MNRQELAIISGMEGCLKAYNAFKARDTAQNAAEFAKRNPDIINYCFFIEESRQAENG